MLIGLVVGTLGAVLAASIDRQTASAAESETKTETQATGPTGARLAPVIHRPANLGSANLVPLVVALHGSGGTPASFQSTGLNAVADRNGFVVACLDSPVQPYPDPSNISYIGSMISQLVASQNIDPRRVYVVGFSIGGYATYRSACELSGQIAAIAAVSQAMAPLANQPCNVSHPVSELEIAGTSDLFPIHQTAGLFISADQTATIWRSINGCSPQSTTSQIGPTVQTTWSSCDDGSSVAEYVVNGGTHIWPGSPGTVGADAQYDAAQALWSFLSAHQSSAVTTAEAKLVSLRVRGGRPRKLQAVIRVMESSVQVQVTLTAHGHGLTSKKFTLLQGAGDGLTLLVPSHARQSQATVKFAFVDSYGRRLTVVRSIRIPK